MYPKKILHWISDSEFEPHSKRFFDKYSPARGEVIAKVAAGSREDVMKALEAAQNSLGDWSRMSVVARAEILRNATLRISAKKEELAEIVALEAGKSIKDSLAEVSAAIECGFFFAGEGRRYYGEVLTSGVGVRHVEMIRQPVGVGALIVPFNNPAAGVAWKIFPALLCGNSVVIKSHELTPYVALWYAKIFKEAGVPVGVISVIQGMGSEAGIPLVENINVKFISFTGSAETGRKILHAGADRLAKISIEAGGKNPFVVCDDADLPNAAKIAVASAFVDAGQRCAAASRIIVFDSVYEEFKKLFLEEVKKISVGIGDRDTYGAIISEERMRQILGAIQNAVGEGAKITVGGGRIGKEGYFIDPTVLEGVSPNAEIFWKEIFGPVVCLFRVRDFNHALNLANLSVFKLSGSIHTKSIHRAREFVERYRAGVVRVNGPTFGSEPHMPFGGIGFSGNGWREPGTKALDFYSDWKQISIDYDPRMVA